MRLFLFSILFVTILPLSVHARGIDDATESELRSIIDGHIAQMSNAFTDIDGVIFTNTEPYTVEQSDGYFAVTFPSIKAEISDPENPIKPKTYLDFGSLAMNVVPDPNDKNIWKTTMTASSQWVITHEKQGRVEVNMGDQNTSAVYDAVLHGFTSIDSTIRHMNARHITPDNTTKDLFSVSKMHSHQNLQRKENGYYSGPVTFNMDDFKVTAKGPNNEYLRLTLPSVTIKGNLKDLDPAKMQNLQDARTTLQNPDAIDRTLLLKTYFDSLTMYDENSFVMQLKDMTLESAFNNPKDGELITGNMSLTKMDIGFSLKGGHQDAMDYKSFIRFSGLDYDFPFVSEISHFFIPRTANFTASIENLPIKSWLTHAMSTPPEQKITPDYFLKSAELAKSALRIEHLDVANDKTSVEISIKANPGGIAPYFANGDVSIHIKGLHALEAQLSTMLTDPQTGPTIKPQIQQAMMGIASFKMFAQAIQNEAGETVHILEGQLGKNGTIMMNGNDITPLLQSMTGVQP